VLRQIHPDLFCRFFYIPHWITEMAEEDREIHGYAFPKDGKFQLDRQIRVES